MERVASYDELYPSAIELSFVEGDLLKATRSQPCSGCGRQTSWIEVNFGAYLCSEDCAKQAWNDYVEASMWGNRL
jgi:hypothetical protein